MKKLVYLVGACVVLLSSCKKDADIDSCMSSDESSVLVGEVVQFTNCTEEYLTKEWDFGDGGNTTVNNPTHKFEEAGEYDVVLYVTNEDGSFDESTLKITVDELRLTKIDVEDFDITDVNALIDYSLDGTKLKEWDWDWYEYTMHPNVELIALGSSELLTLENYVVVDKSGLEFIVEKLKFSQSGTTNENAMFSVDPYADLDFTAAKLELDASNSATGTSVTFTFVKGH